MEAGRSLLLNQTMMTNSQQLMMTTQVKLQRNQMMAVARHQPRSQMTVVARYQLKNQMMILEKLLRRNLRKVKILSNLQRKSGLGREMNTILMIVITITMALNIIQSIHNTTLIMTTIVWPMSILIFLIISTWD